MDRASHLCADPREMFCCWRSMRAVRRAGEEKSRSLRIILGGIQNA